MSPAEVHIEPYRPEMAAAAAQVLARAFVTNPLHVATFGAGELRRNEAFFRAGFALMKGSKLVALEDDRILGLIHWVASPGCRFSGGDKLRMLPAMRGIGVLPAWRVRRWLAVWSRHDPHEPHGHLGPIGVEPCAQGRSIGRQLMERYCAELDSEGIAGYLETDRAGNVAFYSRFGFEVLSEEEILGVPNRFMWRRPRPASG